MRLLVIALVVVILTSEIALSRQLDWTKWTHHEKKHGKVYKTPKEARRSPLLVAAKDKIRSGIVAAKNLSNEHGLDSMSDWTREELARLASRLSQETEPKQSNEAQLSIRCI